MTLSMDRIRELDRKWGVETRKFLYLGVLYGDPPPFFLMEECETRLSEMAKKWDVQEQDFRIFVGLHKYLNLVARGEEGLPSPEAVAKELHIPLARFLLYYREQVELTRNALAPDEDDDISLWRSAVVAEWDEEEDLQEDAARRGLCYR